MKTPSRALSLPAAIGLVMAILRFASPLAAQEGPSAPNGEISCSSNFGNPVDLGRKSFHLIPAPAGEIAGLRKSKPAISVGPFDKGTSQYDAVDVYLVEKDASEARSTESTVSIFIRASRNHDDSWFTVSQDSDDRVNYDFFQRTKGDAGFDTAIDPDNDSGPQISLALKNAAVPIFQVSWWRQENGASTFAAVQKILLLDFRPLHPSVLSVLKCVAAEGGGVCGVYDNGTAPTTKLSCSWETFRADFLCTSTASGDFTPFVTHRYYLGSGADAPYPAKEGDPPSLNALGSWVFYNSLKSKTVDIPGLGTATVLGQYSPAGERDKAVLVATGGRDSFEPRYFAVVVNPEGPTAAFQILPQALVDERVPASATEVASAPTTQGNVIPALVNAAEEFANENSPLFQVQSLESLPNASVWQVMAQRDTSHEIVWLAAGFNPETGRFVFSAVRIASEFGRYTSCGRTRSDPFAAAIDRKKGTMDAILDVEPAHQYTQEGKREDLDDQGNPTTPCPMRVKLLWNTSAGFIREETGQACPDSTRARNLSITQAGQITTKPDDTEEQ